ncbi:MAG: hypothetical protein D6782_05410, partial [Alphaproteobacteria bacterium]
MAICAPVPPRYAGHMKMLGAFMLCFALAAFVQAQDGGLPAGLVAGGQARVASLVDGDTLTLDDGR